MEPPARKAYHRINLKLYNQAKATWKTLYEHSRTPEHYGLKISTKTQDEMQSIARMLKSIETAFESRPNAVESGSHYLRGDDLAIRHMLKVINQKILNYDGWKVEREKSNSEQYGGPRALP